MSVELDTQQLVGLLSLGFLAGYLVGCFRAAVVERRSR